MTDEWYKKRQLEEMQKQTECMENQNKLLKDIRDIGLTLGLQLSVLAEKSVNPLGVTEKDIEKVGDLITETRKRMEKRWSE